MTQRIFDRRMNFVMLIVISLLLANAWLGYIHTRQLYQYASWVGHTHEVIQAVQNVIHAITNAETAQRGYIITEDPSYQALYNNYQADLQEYVKQLETVTADNPRQQSRVLFLRSAIAAKLTTMDENVRFGFADSHAIRERMNRGRDEMNMVRAVTDEMEKNELILLQKRSARTEGAYYKALSSSLVMGGICLLALAGFLSMVRRYWKAHQETAAAVFQEREWFRTTLSSIADAVITTDTHGGVTYLNPVAQSLTGWELAEAKGLPLEQIFSIHNEKTGNPVDNPVAKVLNSGTAVGLANHTVLISRDGTKRPIDDSAAPIRDQNNEIRGVVLIFRDVSDARRSQEELHQSEIRYRALSEELAHSNRELEQFAYIASHDLQEPLHVVSSFADLLGIRAVKKLEPKELEYLQFIKQASSQAKTLIKELLEFSRIGRDGATQSVNLHQILEEIKVNLRVSIDRTRAEIVYDGLPTVEAVRSEVLQLFQNLISNAIKYATPDLAPNIIISWSRVQNMYLFSIKDNGIGIDPQYQERIFEMFERLHTKAESAGTGIGLAICKKIVERYGGRIWLESELGQGSVFYFTLKASP